MGKIEQWSRVEETVSEAEKSHRQARRASSELSRKTGITRIERKAREYGAATRDVAKAQKAEGIFETTRDAFLGPEDSDERSLVSFREKELRDAVKKMFGKEGIARRRAVLFNEEADQLKRMSDPPSASELEALEEIRADLAKLQTEERALLEESPEAFAGLHLFELKEYKEQLQRGRIVETPYVKEQIEDFLVRLRAGTPILVYGHLGSGKTELCMHMAREHLGREALVISGSKNISLAEFYGHQVLAIDKMDTAELDTFVKEIEKKYKEWRSENPDEPEEEKQRAHDRIVSVYSQSIKGGTISEYFLGPIYRAMREGRPVIIDEVNAIPHEILISLNHILTRKVGDIVPVQQDSGDAVTVQEGFGLMMTANLNQGQERYVDRQELDPAFLSRLYKKEYNYLPQAVRGSLAENRKNHDVQNDLFRILIARVMDNHGDMTLPVGSAEKLWRLAQAARITQDVFAGRDIDSAYYFTQGGSKPLRYLLKEGVCSPRALEKIFLTWTKSGFATELDRAIWDDFIAQSTIPSDRAYLYQLFKDQFGFFKSNGWEQSPNYGSGGNVLSFDVNPPRNASGQKKYISARETVEMCFGPIPERKRFPDTVLTRKKKGQTPERPISDLPEKLTALQNEVSLLEQEMEILGVDVTDFLKP